MSDNDLYDIGYIYRVVTLDGQAVWTGRGSDPFTIRASARRRCGQLNNALGLVNYKVQRSMTNWEDDE